MSARPMTVLQVVPELQTGGAERTTVDIAAALVAEGDRALVVSAGGRLVPELLAVGGEHVTMPARTKSAYGLWRNARRFADLMEREGVDIVHARSRAPAWSAYVAASWTRRPFVATYHGVYNERSRLKNRYNSVMARGPLTIANSDYTARIIAERHPFAAGRIVTIHRGVDLAGFDADSSARVPLLLAAWGVDPADRLILQLARLTHWKGHEVVLDALAQLARSLPEGWVCVMAGDDQGRTEYRDRLLAKAAKLAIADRVRIVGHVADVPAALAATTVAVQASVEPEAFGRAAVEAQAAGVPVIVSDLGAVRETVLAPPQTPAAEATGWRVPPGDAGALSTALLEALSAAPEQLSAIGERGRAHALAHFSLEAMKKKTLGVYHSLLD